MTRKHAILLTIEELEPRCLLSTYYVSTTGNDNSVGSSTAPFATLQHAMLSLEPGDTLNVESGSYGGFIAGWDSVPASSGDRYGTIDGTASAPITIQADPSATPGSVIINNPNNKTQAGIDLEPGINYVTISGLVIDGTSGGIAKYPNKGEGIKIADANDIVENCIIKNINYGQGILADNADNVVLQGNMVSGTGDQGNPDYGHGIYLSGTLNGAVVQGNVIYNNTYIGIHVNGDLSEGGTGLVTNAVIRGNQIFNNGQNGINADGLQSSVIENNLIYGYQDYGITLYQSDAAAPSQNNVIVNNTIVSTAAGADSAVRILDGSTGNKVLNSILLGGGGVALRISSNSVSGLISDYNVTSGTYQSDDTGATQTFSQWRGSTGEDTHSFTATQSQLFVNAASNNYQLSATSPAINAGTALDAPSTDLLGYPRPSDGGYDIGCYQHLSGTVITITTATLANWTANQPGYSQTIVASSGKAPYTFTETGTLPIGLSLSSAGVLSGTPTTAGSYSFTVKVTDSTGATASKSYTVLINMPIAFTTGSLAGGSVGIAYSQSIAAEGGTGSLQFSVSGTLPSGITLSNSGLLVGTPTTPGSYSFTVTATDGVGASSSHTYFLTIQTGPLSQYLVTLTGSSTIQAGCGFLVMVQAADSAGDPVTSYSGPSSVTATVIPSNSASTFPETVVINSIGLGYFLASLQKVGTYTISVSGGMFGGSSGPVTVVPGAAVKLAFSNPAPAVFAATTSSSVTLPGLDIDTFTRNFTQVGMTLTTTFDTASSSTANPPGDGTTVSAVYQGYSAAHGTLYAYVYQIQINQMHTGDITSLENPWNGLLVAAKFDAGMAGVNFTLSPNGYSISGDSSGANGFLYKITGGAPSGFAASELLSNGAMVGLRDPSVVSGISAGSTDPVGAPLNSQLLVTYPTHAPLTSYSDILVTFSTSPPASTAGELRDGGDASPQPTVYSPAGVVSPPTSTATGDVLPALSVQVQDAYGNVVTSDNSDNVKLSIDSGPGSFTASSTTMATVSNGIATFDNLALVASGTYTLMALVRGMYTGPISAPLTVVPLQVVAGSLVGTPSGFSLQFNAPYLVDSVTPVLYGAGFGAAAPASSVTLTGPSGPVEGSVILDTATDSLSFLATNTAELVNNSTPILPDGTYTVDVRSSGTSGLQALDSGGGFLDGLATGQPGSGDYTATFTVNAAAAGDDVVWAPDTADGPGQVLAAPGENQAGLGYPVYLSARSANVTKVQFTLDYDPTLLTVTGSTGTGFSLLSTPVPGQAIFQYMGPALPAGEQTIVGFVTATVPSGTAASPTPYKAKNLLHFANVSLNNGGQPGVGGDALHVVAYVGDADGNGSYNSNDAVLITRVGLQTDTGFTAYPLIDPVIVADTDGSGFIPADAALQINEAGVGFPTTNLSNPPIPSGVYFQAISNNVDPTLSIPTRTTIAPDGTVTVAVNIDDAHPDGSTGLIRAHLALDYNPALLAVSADDVHVGSLLASSSWILNANVNSETGQIWVGLASSIPISESGPGTLVTIDFHLMKPFSGPLPIAFAPSVNPTGQHVVTTELEDTQGAFILTLQPVNVMLIVSPENTVSSLTCSLSANSDAEAPGVKPAGQDANLAQVTAADFLERNATEAQPSSVQFMSSQGGEPVETVLPGYRAETFPALDSTFPILARTLTPWVAVLDESLPMAIAGLEGVSQLLVDYQVICNVSTGVQASNMTGPAQPSWSAFPDRSALDDYFAGHADTWGEAEASN
jgi:hypothetical protein